MLYDDDADDDDDDDVSINVSTSDQSLDPGCLKSNLIILTGAYSLLILKTGQKSVHNNLTHEHTWTVSKKKLGLVRIKKNF